MSCELLMLLDICRVMVTLNGTQPSRQDELAYRDPVWQEPVQVCLGNDEAVLALSLGRHLLLPQPLSLLNQGSILSCKIYF